MARRGASIYRSSEEMSVHWTTHHSPTVIAFNWAKHSLAFLARYWMIQEFVASSPSPFLWFSEQVWSLALHLQEAMI